MSAAHPAIRTDDGRTCKPHFRKGFHVQYDKSRGLYRAYLTHPRTFVGSSRDYMDAVRIGISAAYRARTLNWKAAVAWSHLRGVQLSYDDAFYTTKGTTPKGFYVRRNGASQKNPRYEILIGESAKTAKFAGSDRSKHGAIKYALRVARTKPYYNEAAAIEWLHQQGWEYIDLIPLARIEQKTRKSA